jgi:hypothetical protein
VPAVLKHEPQHLAIVGIVLHDQHARYRCFPSLHGLPQALA